MSATFEISKHARGPKGRSWAGNKYDANMSSRMRKPTVKAANVRMARAALSNLTMKTERRNHEKLLGARAGREYHQQRKDQEFGCRTPIQLNGYSKRRTSMSPESTHNPYGHARESRMRQDNINNSRHNIRDNLGHNRLQVNNERDSFAHKNYSGNPHLTPSYSPDGAAGRRKKPLNVSYGDLKPHPLNERFPAKNKLAVDQVTCWDKSVGTKLSKLRTRVTVGQTLRGLKKTYGDRETNNMRFN